jgi:hypothetical protein
MPLQTRVVSELPTKLAPGFVYLVGEYGHPWQVALVCPCGCGEVVQLNLLPPGPPLWQAERGPDGNLTLWPSIRRSVGCQSHFWIRRGRVLWPSPTP